MQNPISKFYSLRWPKFLALFFFILLFTAYTQIFAVFIPGETLDPTCAPLDKECRIQNKQWEVLGSTIYYNQGEIGIGMTNPSVALDIVGDIEYTGTITDVSDERLKENVVPITGSLEKVLGIKGKYYNMKETPGRLETGFIAQNVQEYMPTAVSTIDPVNGYLGVSYPALMPIAFGAIQELDQMINNLSDVDSSIHQRINDLSDVTETLDLKLEILNEESVKITTLNSLVKDFLSDAINNLDLVFFGEVRMKKLCLDDLCITKSELQKILDHTYLVPASTPDTNDDEDVNNDEEEDGSNNEDENDEDEEADESNDEDGNDDADQNNNDEDDDEEGSEDNDSNEQGNNGGDNGNGGEGDTDMNGNQENNNGNGALDNNDREKNGNKKS